MYRNVWRNQKNNKKLWFEEGETMQWQNEKGQDSKQEVRNETTWRKIFHNITNCLFIKGWLRWYYTPIMIFYTLKQIPGLSMVDLLPSWYVVRDTRDGSLYLLPWRLMTSEYVRKVSLVVLWYRNLLEYMLLMFESA